MFYINEIRMGIGIPDIMIGNKVIENFKKVIDYYELELYHFLIKTRIRTITSLFAKYKYSEEHIKKYIKALIEKNIIKVDGNKIIIIERIDKKKIGTNISIEAKLKDWKGALVQAERYLIFSEYSYVALPSEQVGKVDVNCFGEKGVGLLAVSNEGIVEILKAEKSPNCNNIYKYIAISYLNNKYDKEGNTCRRL